MKCNLVLNTISNLSMHLPRHHTSSIEDLLQKTLKAHHSLMTPVCVCNEGW